MSASSAHHLLLLAYLVIVALCEDTKESLVKAGDDVILQCQAPKNAAITLLVWNKNDLKLDDYVIFFRENHLYDEYQLLSVRGRVQLKDPDMKNGDMSVILRNVTVSDTATYECRIKTVSKGRRRRSTPELLSTIKLKVEDEGHTAARPEEGGNKEAGKTEGGNLHTYLPVAVITVIIIIGSGLVLWKRQRFMKMNSEQPAAAEAVELQTLHEAV